MFSRICPTLCRPKQNQSSIQFLNRDAEGKGEALISKQMTLAFTRKDPRKLAAPRLVADILLFSSCSASLNSPLRAAAEGTRTRGSTVVARAARIYFPECEEQWWHSWGLTPSSVPVGHGHVTGRGRGPPARNLRLGQPSTLRSGVFTGPPSFLTVES